MHIHFPLKEPTFLTGITNSRSGGGNTQHESETACARMQRVTGPKEHTSPHEGTPDSQNGTIWGSEETMNEMVETQ